MRTVSAADANRYFSKILRDVKAGETIVVTSRGEPVATIRPGGADDEDAQDASKRALLDHLRAQPTLNMPVAWTRDDLYDE